MKDSIVNFIATKNIDTQTFVAVGCDGTAVNTGNKGGAIKLLEKEYNKPLQWLIFLLHANELPLRHLLIHLDGSTTGPKAFSGPIGKALVNCQTLPVVAFEKIDVTLPTVILEDLSTDQKYLWEMCEAISKGDCSLALSKRNPGGLNHSRWLTTAVCGKRANVDESGTFSHLRHESLFTCLVQYKHASFMQRWCEASF